MAELEIIVATMHQTDFSLIDKMNLKGNVIIANQSDHFAYAETDFPEGHAKMITTPTVGVGLNRNIGLLLATAEYVLFADDDLKYSSDGIGGVHRAIRELTRADLIIFGIEYTKNNQVVVKKHLRTKRAHVWNSMSHGGTVIAAKRSSLLRQNIVFNQYFGGGCRYSSGEDSLFLKHCFDRGLRIYQHEHVLGTSAKDSSTWFTAYDQKYFFDKGALLYYLFPKLNRLMIYRFAITFDRKTELSVKERIHWMRRGLQAGRELIPYERVVQ